MFTVSLLARLIPDALDTLFLARPTQDRYGRSKWFLDTLLINTGFPERLPDTQ